MKKEMVLYEKSEIDRWVILRIGLITLIIMLIIDYSFMDYTNERQLIFLTILFPLITAIFTFILISVYQYNNKPQKLLSISRKGLYYHFKNFQIAWDEISEIQIIDSVLSVTVDTEPEKDFKLQLYSTDFYVQRMTIDEFVKLINCYYEKNIYTYTSPPSCGCC